MTRSRFTVSAFLLATSALASVSLAQAALLAPPAAPCASLGSPPTVDSCWSCFQSLLGDCDKGNNNNADRRRACYEGANNFFTWCLGRVSAPAPAPIPPRRKDGKTMNLREGFSYDISFSSNVDPSTIEVYVRDIENGEVRQQQVKVFAVADKDGTISIFFDNNNLNIEDDSSIGVVTVVRNPATNLVELAVADVVEVVEALDLDNDGTVGDGDFTEAWNQYSQGTLSFDDFVEFINKYMTR